jgi:protein-L-isoaspartate O-methyltransferase
MLLLSLLLAGVCFAGVLLVGAPYLPTLKPQITAALDLLDLQPGQTLLELGSGDGAVLLAAAQRGLQVVGIELNPLLVIVARVRTWRYRKQVRIIWGSFWHESWPACDGVFVFLLDRFMPKLDERMQEIGSPLVSVAFRIPNRQAIREQDGVFRYDYAPKNR